MPRTKKEITAELVRIQKEYERLQNDFIKIAKDAKAARIKGISNRDASALAKLRKTIGLK